MRRFSWTIARNDLTMTFREPALLVTLVVMPLVVIAFVRPLLRLSLVNQGFRGANGSESAVPGMACLFAFFLVSFVGYSILQEHGWHTWDRLRVTSARPWEIVLGKAIPAAVVGLVQQCSVFLLGWLVYDFRLSGSPLALALVSLALCACLVSMGLALAALCQTVQQVNVFGNLSALLLGGLGGAITPIALLPGWAQGLARAAPSYWALRGFRVVALEQGRIADVAGSIGMLGLFTLAFGTVAVTRLRTSQTKRAMIRMQ